MKSQKHNEGKLAEVTVKIEEKLVADLQNMAKNSGLSIDDIVAVALKRFRSSHLDYLRATPIID
jgi:fructose-1,6-bisphosphatase/sedoheptulose 1,7-bisphosphatase-like protein